MKLQPRFALVGAGLALVAGTLFAQGCGVVHIEETLEAMCTEGYDAERVG